MNIAGHQKRLWRTISDTVWWPPARPIRPALRAGFMAHPRHGFLRRFRPFQETELRRVTAATLRWHLPAIYVDAPLAYAAGDRFGAPAATSSQPSFLLHVLERLDPRPGQRVLEIGSGGGWIAAILGHAVGPSGAVVGVERLGALAAESRRSLARAGVRNVRIVAGDGAGARARGPFDRLLVSAGAGTVPRAWFDRLADGGLMVVPLHVPGGGEEIYLLRRVGAVLRSEGAIPAWFVPLVGPAGRPAPLDLAADRAVAALLKQRGPRVPVWFGGAGGACFTARTTAFRSFLYKTEPDFCAIAEPAGQPTAFGLIDRTRGSLAICRPDAVESFGTRAALDRLTRAYCRWTGMFMPPGTAFTLTVRYGVRARRPRAGVHDHAEARFEWRLGPPPGTPA